jgi:hypothetical protein
MLDLNSIAIATDGFRRAAFSCILRQGDFFGCDGLSVDVAVARIFLPLEEERRNFGAHSAVDAAGVVVIEAGNVFRHFVHWISHVMIPFLLLTEHLMSFNLIEIH